MQQELFSFSALRRRIRHAGERFRRDTDNSRSLFHPREGFVTAYSVSSVESALDAYERSQGLDTPLTETALLRMTQALQHSPDANARVVARELIKYLEPRVGRLEKFAPHMGSRTTIIDWRGP